MSQKEFKDYMDQQIQEIEKYKAAYSECNPDSDPNECVFEWIENNAKDFRDNWDKN